MNYYRVSELTTIPIGTVVSLDLNQVRRRKMHVEKIRPKKLHESGRQDYRLTNPCFFKVGEVLGIKGDMNKQSQSKLVKVDQDGVPIDPDERAREDDGTFTGDDPDTPDVDEAYMSGAAPVSVDANGIAYDKKVHYVSKRKDKNGLWLTKKVK